MKISIIGGGFMGEAILKGMINSKQFDNKDISVIEIDKNKRANLAKYNIIIQKCYIIIQTNIYFLVDAIKNEQLSAFKG